MQRLSRLAAFSAIALFTGAISGCSYIPWLGSSNAKPQLPKADGASAVTPAWTVSVGGSHTSALVPAVADGRVYVAHPDGTILVVDEKTGAQNARFSLPAGSGKIGGGVGVGGGLVIVSTQKAEVFAFDASSIGGAPKWRVRVPTESIVPAAVSDGVVVVPTIDGNIVGLDAKDGSRKWVVQRQIPALTVRAGSTPVATRGGAFVGTPTGRLLAFDLVTGAIGWEATVANPKGASELERLIDVAGRPALNAQVACAAAYQGRVACFDLQRGTPVWSRDIGSLSGVVLDDKHAYVTDDKGVAYALDRSTGGTIWKQDVLASRIATGVALVGQSYLVLDNEGNVHTLDKATGRITGRSLGTTKVVGGLAQGESLAYALTSGGQLVAFGGR
ncbi:MAG: outer membrane protein assembly factor BamB [Casimicrobium sp.]